MASAATAGRLYASTASAAAAASVASAAYAAATRTAPASFTSSTVSAAAASFPSLGAVRAHKDGRPLPLAAEVGGNPKAEKHENPGESANGRKNVVLREVIYTRVKRGAS